MGSEEDSAYERLLTANLNRTIDWVKYGDTKNAALLAFTSAWLIGVGNMIASASHDNTPALIAVFLYFNEFLLLLGATQAIAALLPRTKVGDFIWTPRRTLKDLFNWRPRNQLKPNLLFFGDVQALEPDLFKGEILRRYHPKRGRVITEDYINDLCTQTVINSRIAQRKFDLFNRGVALIFSSLCLMLVPWGIMLLRIIFV